MVSYLSPSSASSLGVHRPPFSPSLGTQHSNDLHADACRADDRRRSRHGAYVRACTPSPGTETEISGQVYPDFPPPRHLHTPGVHHMGHPGVDSKNRQIVSSRLLLVLLFFNTDYWRPPAWEPALYAAHDNERAASLLLPPRHVSLRLHRLPLLGSHRLELEPFLPCALGSDSSWRAQPSCPSRLQQLQLLMRSQRSLSQSKHQCLSILALRLAHHRAGRSRLLAPSSKRSRTLLSVLPRWTRRPAARSTMQTAFSVSQMPTTSRSLPTASRMMFGSSLRKRPPNGRNADLRHGLLTDPTQVLFKDVHLNASKLLRGINGTDDGPVPTAPIAVEQGDHVFHFSRLDWVSDFVLSTRWVLTKYVA